MTTLNQSKLSLPSRGKTNLSLLLVVGVLSIASSVVPATAATPKAGAACSPATKTTMISNKSFTCAPNAARKLSWIASSAIAKSNFGNNSGPGNPADDAIRQAGFKKYTDCLTKQGVTLPKGGFGRRGTGIGGAGGAGGNNASPRPTLSAAQQAAMTKCASLRPAFGRGGFGSPGASGAASGNFPGGAIDSTKSAAYISCLNTNGVNVTTMADLSQIDRQSPKVIAALKTCAEKIPFVGKALAPKKTP